MAATGGIGHTSADLDPAAVLVQGVWRRFGGSDALRGVDFVASPGEVTGLVGPNGAGKTTLLLILSTLLAADQGVVRIGGHDPLTEAREVRRILGWVPDTFGFYEHLTGREYLTFSGRARALSKALAGERAEAMLALVRLEEWSDRPVHVLSRGQKQRLAFASALVHEPAILLLDEPTAGLDPTSRAEFLRLVRHLSAQGVALVISSHLLGDLEQMADRVVFMDRGVTVGERSMGEPPVTKVARVWRLHSLDDVALAGVLDSMAVDVVASSAVGVDVTLVSEPAAAALFAALVEAGVAVVSCGPVETSLETTYFELTVPE